MNSKIILIKNEEHRILKGHYWIFSNEINKIEGTPIVGEIVSLYNSRGSFLGVGFYNPNSLISVRLFSKENINFDKIFLSSAIQKALHLREKLFNGKNVYRLIHGESDGLPGLIIDRFNDNFSIQTFSAGIDQRLELIVEVIKEIFSPKTIIERNESPLRILEGLSEKSGFLFGDASITEIDLDGIKYEIDLLNGQKTGFFLDQRLNRKSIIPFCKNSNVLDCFCNEGGFSLTAATSGAKNVIAIDISKAVIDRVNKNIKLNNLSNVETKVEDVFESLKIFSVEKKKFDLIILDPPSFTKSKKNVSTAKRGYLELNTNALKLISSGGFLATSSCSHHIDKETFLNIINESGIKSGKALQLLTFSGPSPDHPELLSMPETSYLKFAIFHVQ